MSDAGEAEHLTEVRRWLRFAREDLAAAQASLRYHGFVPRQACFLAQQAAEKAPKAILVFLQVDFPRRHDLDALRNLIPPDWSVTLEPLHLQVLTEWAVEARYPGDLPEPTDEDAREALSLAQAVCAPVYRDFAARGIRPGS